MVGVESLVRLEAGLVSLGKAVVVVVFTIAFDEFLLPLLADTEVCKGLELLLLAELSFCWELCCLHLARRFLNQTYKREKK